MNRARFYGIAILTGYLQYLLSEFEFFLRDYVIERCEEFNPECEIPHLVAASSDFYLDTVLKDQSELNQLYVPMTVENATRVLDNVSMMIHQITEVQYPLKKLGILSALIETQVHINDEATLDEIQGFLKQRLLDRKLYFIE